MYVAAQASTTPPLVVIASAAQDGPLVTSLSAAVLAAAATNPSQLVQYVNSRLMTAEAALSEGAPVEMDITGWETPLGSGAQFVATQINNAFAAGRIIDPISGAPPQPWAGESQIAWGDDGTDTVTIRVLKAQPPVIALYVIIGLLAVVAIAAIWSALHGSTWTAKSTSGGVNGTKVFTTIFGFIVRNWWWEAPALGVAVAAPFLLTKAGETEEAVNRIRYAERGGF